MQKNGGTKLIKANNRLVQTVPDDAQSILWEMLDGRSMVALASTARFFQRLEFFEIFFKEVTSSPKHLRQHLQLMTTQVSAQAVSDAKEGKSQPAPVSFQRLYSQFFKQFPEISQHRNVILAFIQKQTVCAPKQTEHKLEENHELKNLVKAFFYLAAAQVDKLFIHLFNQLSHEVKQWLLSQQQELFKYTFLHVAALTGNVSLTNYLLGERPAYLSDSILIRDMALQDGLWLTVRKGDVIKLTFAPLFSVIERKWSLERHALDILIPFLHRLLTHLESTLSPTDFQQGLNECLSRAIPNDDNEAWLVEAIANNAHHSMRAVVVQLVKFGANHLVRDAWGLRNLLDSCIIDNRSTYHDSLAIGLFEHLPLNEETLTHYLSYLCEAESEEDLSSQPEETIDLIRTLVKRGAAISYSLIPFTIKGRAELLKRLLETIRTEKDLYGASRIVEDCYFPSVHNLAVLSSDRLPELHDQLNCTVPLLLKALYLFPGQRKNYTRHIEEVAKRDFLPECQKFAQQMHQQTQNAIVIKDTLPKLIEREVKHLESKAQWLLPLVPVEFKLDPGTPKASGTPFLKLWNCKTDSIKEQAEKNVFVVLLHYCLVTPNQNPNILIDALDVIEMGIEQASWLGGFWVRNYGKELQAIFNPSYSLPRLKAEYVAFFTKLNDAEKTQLQNMSIRVTANVSELVAKQSPVPKVQNRQSMSLQPR